MILSLENARYVSRSLSQWRSLPLSMSVIEYTGSGDPFFGGSADDRALGKNGLILTRPYTQDDIAEFATIEQAHEAAQRIPNRRPDSILGVAPRWR